MQRLKRLLIGIALAGTFMVLARPTLYMQDVTCAGSFTPSFNCVITGLWNYTSTAVTAYPVPFKAFNAEVTGIIPATVTLTNAQVLALWSTPITIVPAPGAGKYVSVIGMDLYYAYTGAYTSVSGNNLRLYYGSRQTGNAASSSVTALGFLDATANTAIHVGGIPDNELLSANTAVVLHNVNGVAYGGGNAANKLTVVVNYRIVNSNQ